MNHFKIKRKRQRERVTIVRFVMFYLIILGVLLTIVIWNHGKLFTFKDAMVISLCAIPLCVVMVYVVERFGSGLGSFLSGWSSRRPNIRETLAAEIAKAKYSKREGRFQEALTIIDGVLKKDPNFPDALFLKAQILWKGLGNKGVAKKYLKKVMQLVPKEKTLHRWASSYYDEITGMEKE